MLDTTFFRATSLIFILGAATAAQAAGRPLNPDDFFRIREVHDPQVSPDGLQVAFLVSHNDRDSDAYETTLWMVPWEGGAAVQLTRGKDDILAPRFSPDGRYLSYVSVAPDADQGQLMLLDRRGGEPRALAAVSSAGVSYAWSPDGQRLVVSIPDDATVKAKVPLPIVIDGRHFKEDTVGYLTAASSSHLYLVDVASGRQSALTHDADHDDELPQWSPDGALIAFVRTTERGADPDGMQGVAIIEPRAEAVPRLLARVFAPNHQHLQWTPDGTQLGLLQGQPPRLNAYIADRLALLRVSDGALRALSDPLDRAVMSYALAADGKAFDALIEDDRHIYPLRLPFDGNVPARLPAAAGATTDIAAAGGHTVVLFATDSAAPEVFAVDHGAQRVLTHENDALLAELALGSVEDRSFRSRDGTVIHGLLVRPADYVAGRRYPAILWIHGGPNGEDEHSLLFDGYPLQLERQLLAARGYVVLAVNYRGSSGRGSAFQQAIVADWGHKEVQDLLAGVDDLVASGIADAARLGIGGWSYGGLLTDYTIASDRRFRAAISGAGSANQLALYGSDEYILQENNEFGPPWKSQAAWLKVSYPFYHADRITTPTLFMGGEKDFNVPVTGSEQMYAALRTLGVPTQLVVYPGEYHILTRPSYIRDRAGRILDWYDRYLPAAP